MVARVGGALTRGPAATAAFVAAAAVVAVVAVPPVVALAASAIGHTEILAEPQTWRLLARSVAVAAVVAALAAVVGIPLGIALASGRVRGARPLLAVHALPLFLPPLFTALGAFHLLGRRGVAGNATTSAWLFSTGGVVAVLTTALAPLVTILAFVAARQVPRSIVDAARMVAPRWRVAIRIGLPAVWPVARVGVAAVFALALADAVVPMYLGVPGYAAALFARIGGAVYAPGAAAALCVPLVVIGAALAIATRGGRVPLATRPAARWTEPPGAAATALAAIAALVAATPLVALITRARAASLAEIGRWTGDAISTSLATAIVAAGAITALAIVIGHRIARHGRGATWVGAVAWTLFLTPPAALAVGLVASWNRDATAWIYDTTAIIVVGYAARYAILGVRPVAALIGATSPGIEESAAVAGAPFVRRLAAIVRLHGRALAVVWALVAVMCLRDVETTAVYYPAGGETLPVRIFQLDANGPQAVVAALAVVHAAIAAALLAAAAWLARGRRT